MKTKIQTATISTEAIFSEDENHRFSLKYKWGKGSNIAKIILLNPSHANGITLDKTIYGLINFLIEKKKIDGIEVVNLFSVIGSNSQEIAIKYELESKEQKENNKVLEEFISNSSEIYIGWGMKKTTTISAQIEKVKKWIKSNPKPIELFCFKKEGDKIIGRHPRDIKIDKIWKIKKFTF
ncbi:MAG: hypothetical protein RL708_1871 [Bacteroidota bacterium]